MAYENIRLRKPNFAMVNGYFWTFDEDTDSVVVKTDDGTTAFSYPLETTLTNAITSMEFDGRNLWTLETLTASTVAIKRWYINNYVCKLRNTFNMTSGSHTFESEAFTVEHYHIEFDANEPAGSSILSVTDGSEASSGYTLYLGPNSLGQSEEVTVNSAGASSIQINGVTTYAYDSGDPISFHKKIWLFNNYDGNDDTTGALYEIDAYTGSVIAKTAGGAYQNVSACTFFGVPKYVFDRSVGPSVVDPRYNSICFVKGSNTIFLNPDALSSSYASMTMDNIEDDQATVIDIYDLTIEGTNVYRLQAKATYYGTTGTFSNSTYNYQLSSLNPFITSISLRADPAILPANGVNNSDITALVKDQFNLPIVGRQVTFTDDDPVGAVSPTTDNTDSNGEATTTYTSGTSAREVRITATAQQT